MKRVLVFAALALSLTASRADLVMQEKMESAMMTGTVTTQIKGNQIRKDMPSSPQGAMSTIMDLNSGDQVVLMHRQKMAMKVSGAMVKQMAENMVKNQSNGGTNTPPKFTDTGRTEKVGDYDTEIYTWTSPEGAKETVWVAKNFPDYSKIKAQLDKLNDSPMAQIGRGLTPDDRTLPGMVVKTQMEMNDQKATTTLLSAKEQPVDASVFETPKDYQQMSQPGGPPPNQ